MLWTKRAHQRTDFRVFSALMNLHPIPHAAVETVRSGSN